MSVVAHPRLVALVRDAKGWSQQQLADQAGLSQGYVSKVESGLLDLAGDNLAVVAKALVCPETLLTDDTPIQGLEVTCLHHRRRHSKMTAATKRRIESVTHLTRITVEGLLSGIELIPEAGLQRLDIDEYQDPTEAARALRVSWRIPSGPIPNMLALIESVGVVVVMRALGTTAQDAVSTWPHDNDRPPVMVINTGLAPDKQRFTIAHELGHLVLHSLPSETQEREADAFAAEFLAPAADIEAQLLGLTTRDFPRLLELKAQWGISIAALIRRAKDLRLITDRQYREFHIKISRLGWRTLEPGTLPVERPQTLNEVIEVHRRDHGYSTEELAQAAVMTRGAFCKHYLPEPGDGRPASPLRLMNS